MSRAFDPAQSRRTFLKAGVAMGGAAAMTTILPGRLSAVPAASPMVSASAELPMASPGVVRPALFREAMRALQRHGDRFAHHDRIAIADFNQPSASQRFYLIDLANGATTSLLVAHGRGSDPEHTGWLHRFSNAEGSFASCDGAFLASDYYVGKHGQSQRLIGLDSTNNNALSRAIVIHAAWYANRDMLGTHGQLGRSEGCFAVGEHDLQQVFARLGTGRMLYSAKV
jgi:hypothetical protein